MSSEGGDLDICLYIEESQGEGGFDRRRFHHRVGLWYIYMMSLSCKVKHVLMIYLHMSHVGFSWATVRNHRTESAHQLI